MTRRSMRAMGFLETVIMTREGKTDALKAASTFSRNVF
jgi:hypothetical protein